MVATRRSARLSQGGSETMSPVPAPAPPKRATRAKKEVEAKPKDVDTKPRARGRRTRASLSKEDIVAVKQEDEGDEKKRVKEEVEESVDEAQVEKSQQTNGDDAVDGKTEEKKEQDDVVGGSSNETLAEKKTQVDTSCEESGEAHDDTVDEAVDAEDKLEDEDNHGQTDEHNHENEITETTETSSVAVDDEEMIPNDTTSTGEQNSFVEHTERMEEDSIHGQEIEESASDDEKNEDHVAIPPASDDEEDHVAMAPDSDDEADTSSQPNHDVSDSMDVQDEDDDLEQLVGLAVSSFKPSTESSTSNTIPSAPSLVPNTLDSGVEYSNLYLKFNGKKCSHGAELIPERKLAEEAAQFKKQIVYKKKMDDTNTAAHEKKVDRDRIQTSSKWFNMVSNEMTAEAKRDIQLIKLRNYLDPKRFYKSSDHKKSNMPKVFQVGTVIEGAAEFKSNRLSRKERHQTFTEEILHDQAIRSYTKRKYNEIQAVRANDPKKPFKKSKHRK